MIVIVTAMMKMIVMVTVMTTAMVISSKIMRDIKSAKDGAN